MRNLSSELAYFTLKLGQQYADHVTKGQALPDGSITSEVESSPFKLSEDESEWLIRALEASFTQSQTRGSQITSDFRPWLRDSRNDIDFYYWNRLRRFYLEGGVLAPQVVATLDNVTDDLLDYAGDPKSPGTGARRGMVIGHVQSGKTTNYSALICKAADAGYRTIILLAGITNTLRAQTQERLDQTFIGKKSVFNALVQEPLPILTYAINKRFPAYGTSRDSDFTRDPGAGVVFSLAAHNEPIIFVTKKNKAPLTKLRDWLIEQGDGGVITSPLLLIDDEADNASINTSKDPAATTAINGVIREILKLFERRTYIGYTATPFANIFIDPDTNDAMLDDDLFPKHFIKTLDPPSTYVGAARVFASDGDLRESMVRVIRDFTRRLPLNHKSDDPVTELPESLFTAIRVFVLTRAIRVLRGQGRNHCTMMINVSRFNAVQEKVYGQVYAYLDSLKNAAQVSSTGPNPVADPLIAALKADFDQEFSSSGATFDQVLSSLREATASITTVTVNMKGGVLDYRGNREHGLHVIAIGGLALSRGLTLEDLTVSYILRNTAASDTLMQMARWFGYRPDFEDLCRVYLPRIALDHYTQIHEAIEELRTEVRRMQDLGMTPEHFGLKVRESPTAIRITAANKMRTATPMVVAADYSERHLEGYILANDQAINGANIEEVKRFFSGLGAPSTALSTDQALFWKGVRGVNVMSLLRGFSFPSAHADLGPIMGGTSLFMDYFSDRLSDEMSEWDVAFPHPKSGTPSNDEIVAGYKFPIRERFSGELVEGGWKVTGARNRVADPNDAKLGLTKEQLDDAAAEKARPDGLRGDKAFCAQRARPLLIVHVFATSDPTKDERVNDLTDPVVSLSFCLPSTRVPSVSRSYQVNAVYRKQRAAEAREDEDDDVILEVG